MFLYLIVGVTLFVIVAVSAGITFAYRAGRNSARVMSERQNASDATQSAKASQNMLATRTNGIRSNDELQKNLDKGTF